MQITIVLRTTGLLTLLTGNLLVLRTSRSLQLEPYVEPFQSGGERLRRLFVSICVYSIIEEKFTFMIKITVYLLLVVPLLFLSPSTGNGGNFH